VLKNSKLVRILEKKQQQNGKTAQWEFSEVVLASKYHEGDGNNDNVMGRKCDTQRSKGEWIQDFCETSWRNQIDEDVQITLQLKQRRLKTSDWQEELVRLLSFFGFHELLQFLKSQKLIFISTRNHLHKLRSWFLWIFLHLVAIINFLLV
jgi:hypothetical protein